MCSLPGSRKPLLRVAVTGGTHGNEMCGVYLARYWLQNPGELQRPSFSAMPVLANPAATAACRRYIDRDLNRTFTLTFLGSTATPDDPYEVKRAQELNQLLGPKGTCQAFDFILDLHNTTANTGACLISEVSQNPFNLHLCHYLQLQNPGLPCRLFQFEPPGTESYTLELGPQPQGVLRAELFSQMRAMVASILDFIELFNQGMEFPAFEMEVYKNLGSVDFPRTTDGHLTGTVHSRLQMGKLGGGALQGWRGPAQPASVYFLETAEPNPASGPAPDTAIRGGLETPPEHPPVGFTNIQTKSPAQEEKPQPGIRREDRRRSRREVLRTGHGCMLKSEVCC
ncbi:N-acyl-aromatic-L-amino acid amidohydrolase (carboxylate-forming) isoform X2 [Rattus norvegicus]|uniref:N-acyl-aromatic-L-amino acid amidohydrolase (carboxylate-forming) isoform X2 n=1 Tax=Rattus norvegicus TaxID=10116 RepID=UPI0019176830|nr:N-acyl-aromatic-L-amino acid amidohydrolase (carboxylate-forming) isoform X2 [Rattus norvegicus]